MARPLRPTIRSECYFFGVVLTDFNSLENLSKPLFNSFIELLNLCHGDLFVQLGEAISPQLQNLYDGKNIHRKFKFESCSDVEIQKASDNSGDLLRICEVED